MSQQSHRNTLPDDNNNPFRALLNRLPPTAMAFVVLMLVLGVMLLLANSIDSTSSTRTMIVTNTVEAATAVATAPTVLPPTTQPTQAVPATAVN